MKILSTIILLGTLIITLLLIKYYFQASTGTSMLKVVSWWWNYGDGHAAVLTFFSVGLLAFIGLMSTSLMMLGQIIVAKPVSYVWIGEGLYKGSDYYYDLNDSDKNRFQVKNSIGDFDFNSTTSLDRLYQIQTLLKFGSTPEDAQFWMAYNLQSRLMRVLLQYAGLLFCGIPIWHILKHYHQAFGGSGLSFSSMTVPFFLLIGIHVLMLLVGHMFLQKKISTIDPVARKDLKSNAISPGDTLNVRLVKKVKKRMDAGNKPYSVHYLAEWTDEQGLKLSAVIGFVVTVNLRSAIKTLDQDTQAQVECIVMDDYKLRPLILSKNKDISIL